MIPWINFWFRWYYIGITIWQPRVDCTRVMFLMNRLFSLITADCKALLNTTCVTGTRLSHAMQTKSHSNAAFQGGILLYTCDAKLTLRYIKILFIIIYTVIHLLQDRTQAVCNQIALTFLSATLRSLLLTASFLVL